MAFVQRQLQLTFSGESTGTLKVAGLRTYATIQQFTGKLGVAAQVRVWGLSEDQMNKYSSRIAAGVGVSHFNLALEAGDIGGALAPVVDGAIWRSYPDFQGSPESAFNVSVAGTVYTASKPIASQSHAGAQDAETLIQAICNVSGLTLVNNGAHAVLRNMTTYGSAVDQIEKIAHAAQFTVAFIGNQVFIWPRGGNRDDVVVNVGPNEGMVGYPEWWELGLIVHTRFDQRIQVGRQMNVTSSIPKAAGLWQIVQVEHELSTMLRNGPWFTHAILVGGPTEGGGQ